jgi:hypothetical protein
VGFFLNLYSGLCFSEPVFSFAMVTCGLGHTNSKLRRPLLFLCGSDHSYEANWCFVWYLLLLNPSFSLWNQIKLVFTGSFLLFCVQSVYCSACVEALYVESRLLPVDVGTSHLLIIQSGILHFLCYRIKKTFQCKLGP